MSLTPGTRLGGYEVTGTLGAGGMGEVYRAVDLKLKRQVALKVLPSALMREPESRQRFEREAQVLASLNHPNIAVLFGVDDDGSSPVLVMELLEGPTLQDRLRSGPLPVNEALDIARQICDALEAAHARGIVHRDLKPGNIKVTPEGQVKVLDFGLARVVEGDGAALAASATNDSPTLSIAQTRAGIVLGTAGYMSPEQARGIPADKRADIWAFGVVLYEMLTGRGPFPAETVADAIAAVLTVNPDFTALPAATPAPIRRLLFRCLTRDRKQRLHDIADARLELNTQEPETALAVKGRNGWPLWAVAGLATVAAVTGMALASRAPHAEAPPMPIVSAILPPEGQRFLAGRQLISPDGRRVLARANDAKSGGPAQLWLRELSGADWRALPGTSGAFLCWSPDSRRILFGSESKLSSLDLDSGAVTQLSDITGLFRGNQTRGIAWNEQGLILMGRNRGGLLQIQKQGPASEWKTEPIFADEIGQAHPGFLPGGRWFYYTSRTNTGRLTLADTERKEPARALFELPTEQAVLFAVDPSSPDRGMFLYHSGTALVGRWFDVNRRVITSDAVPVSTTVQATANGNSLVSLSVPARVMLQGRGATTSARHLVLTDRKGRQVAELAPPDTIRWGHPEFSPDDKTFLSDRLAANVDVWAIDLARSLPSRVTLEAGSEGPALFMPDGKAILYSGQQGSHSGIYRLELSGSGKPELLVKGQFHHFSVSPDGRQIAMENRTGSNSEISTVMLDAPDKIVRVTPNDNFDRSWPQFSPDGRWLMLVSRESGRDELYVQSHPPGKGRWQVSRNGGLIGRWRRDGKEIVFSGGGGLMRVDVRSRGDALEFGMPERLFELEPRSTNDSYFAMTSDGQRFAYEKVVSQGSEPEDRPLVPLTLPLDWMFSVPRASR